MDEYISRDVVLAKATIITEHFHAHGAEPDIVNHVVRVKDIEAIPAADVVPVVRCKDCKYHTAYRCPNDNLHWTHDCTLGNGTDGDDYYCADGERKADE